MGRFQLWFSLFGLTILGVGSYLFPDGALFWLASSDASAQALRFVLCLLVILQLLTEPPRHRFIRMLTGGAAVATALWAVETTTLMTTPIFDSILLMQTAIALGVTALELPADERFIGDLPQTHS